MEFPPRVLRPLLHTTGLHWKASLVKHPVLSIHFNQMGYLEVEVNGMLPSPAVSVSWNILLKPEPSLGRTKWLK